MKYIEFRDTIRSELQRNVAGLSWVELRDRLELPYDRPCPTWTNRLEQEIGLVRVRGEGRALIWKLKGKKR